MEFIEILKSKVLEGKDIIPEEAYALLDVSDKEALYRAAEEITRGICPRDFDSCSIVNVRSGHCSENCKWCAQSAHYKTGCEIYPLMEADKCIEAARYNADRGVRRFSLVSSGRAMKGEELSRLCDTMKEINRSVPISTCASLGLLGREELQQLWDSGVHRYHCNLEAAPSFFPSLCSTHTVDDKIKTINIAREIGFEVCSGGIIGLGETPRQRVELALKLREVHPVSIPINILCPIPGTPLASNAPLTDEEILTTIAIFRFVHPGVQLRFAGGRAKMSRETQLRALAIGMNSGVVGDLLTTVGSKIDEDKALVTEAGYKF